VRVSWRRLLWRSERDLLGVAFDDHLLQGRRRIGDLESAFSSLILFATAFMNRIVNVFGTIDYCLSGSLSSQQQTPASAWIT
jgi:hypothetical protein